MRHLGVWTLLIAVWLSSPAPAQEEYVRPVSSAPKPEDVGGGYVTPDTQRTPPRPAWWYWVDVAALTLAMVAVSLATHWMRSRRAVLILTVLSLAYFGFCRQGCVCPIGSIQNVCVALTDPKFAVHFAIIAFFLLPLAFALVVGRVFCGGVCPLGAIQDLALVRPINVPLWLDKPLRWLPFVYLGLAIWLAIQPAGERDFIICRYDPFVGFFRLTGPAHMLIIGGAFLLVGLFIGRPYCRWLCPYGGLLSILSRVSWVKVNVTPDKELDCGLCAEACPYGAIENLRAKPASCLACARCYGACPRQRVAWGDPNLTVESNTPKGDKQARSV